METLQRTANRGSLATGYDIDNSCKFEDDNDEWLYRANVSGTNTKTWTVSWWFKQTELRSVNGAATEHWTGGAYGEATRAGIFADDRIWIDIGGGDGNTGTLFRSLSTQKIRDTSAWYHIVIACDSTQSTEANRLKVWLNGVEVTAWDQKQYPTLNFGSALAGFGGIQMKWGSADATYHGYSGYLAECNYLDGVTATQNDFGEFDDDSGIWKPIEYTGSYGTNGTYLDFADAADLGDDESGNGNDYTENNISAADQAQDSPTNNFCILNAVYRGQATKYHTVSNGGTFVTGNQSGTAWDAVAATIPLFKGKWYWEIKKNGTRAQTNMLVGVGGIDEHLYNWRALTTITTGAKLMFSYNGGFYANAQGGGFSYDDGDIVSIALDQDNGGFYLRKNGGTWTNSGDPASGSNLTGAQTTTWGTSIPGFNVANNVGGLELNFGGFDGFTVSSGNADANGYGNFEYAPPTGYYAICTKNLAEYG